MKSLSLKSSIVASIISLVASATAIAQVAAPDRAKLGSTLFKWEQLAAKPTPVGQFRAVVDNVSTPTFEKLELHVTTLKPGMASHPPHHHPQEEMILVKEGVVEASINGQTYRAGPGSLFFYAANDVHNLTNVGSTPATYFVINVFTAATRAAPNKPAAESASPEMLRSSAFDWEKLAATPTKTGARRVIVESPTVTFSKFEAHATTLNPGVILAPHPDADEELIIVKEGELEVIINGKTERVGPGSILFFASNEIRDMRNSGKTQTTHHVLRFFTDKTPKASN